jgi:hypothetical protein
MFSKQNAIIYIKREKNDEIEKIWWGNSECKRMRSVKREGGFTGNSAEGLLGLSHAWPRTQARYPKQSLHHPEFIRVQRAHQIKRRITQNYRKVDETKMRIYWQLTGIHIIF